MKMCCYKNENLEQLVVILEGRKPLALKRRQIHGGFEKKKTLAFLEIISLIHSLYTQLAVEVNNENIIFSLIMVTNDYKRGFQKQKFPQG
jgi:hypothetical protein